MWDRGHVTPASASSSVNGSKITYFIGLALGKIVTPRMYINVNAMTISPSEYLVLKPSVS